MPGLRTMGELTTADFDRYFEAVHGHEPYRWQSRLTRQVIEEGAWPDVIDLPTGAGKTAVLDTAVFSLALRPDISPRRIVFVIDRRIVVDQVYERAQLISDRIRAATAGVLADMRRALSTLTDAEQSFEQPLGVAALRGGIPIDGEWARRPDQPWVMVSTVDQFGSRLLFRGYGVSHRMRPVHAGLAGNDCLVILDEVHLSRAFASTLRDASSDGDVPLIRAVNRGLLPRRFAVVEMSATAQTEDGRWFRLQSEDLEESPRLRRIAEARKRAKLVEIGGARPAHESVPKKVLDLIKKELSDGETSVGVIVNRVRTAREVHDTLLRSGIAAHLVTGRMRPIDRQHVLSEISRCVDPDRSEPLDGLTVVVATQAIEVGADFSFDALISEAAPIDSLCQRLGRLDRRGTLAERVGYARCWILGVASSPNPKRPDPVYGDAARQAWEELQALADEGEVEVGPGSSVLATTSVDARAPKCEAPLLLPTHVDAWSQTGPEPLADPPIDDFLHGKERGRESDVSVVWRLDLSAAALELVPPRPAEFLSVPISAFRDWVQGRLEVPVADVDLVPVGDESESRGGRQPAQARRMASAVRWRGRGATGPTPLKHVGQVEPGDVIVVPCEWGGLRSGSWDPLSSPAAATDGAGDGSDRPTVTDLGDEAQIAYGRRATLRLDPRLLAPLSVPPPPGPGDEEHADESPETRVRQWLGTVDDNEVPEWLSDALARLQRSRSFRLELVEPDGASAYYALVERTVDPATLDGSDETPSMTGTAVKLQDHLAGAGRRAAAYGRALALPEAVVGDLQLAGELHDLGKVDPRFQAQLHGHDPVRLAESTATGEPLAKSLPGARPHRDKWPPVRHEFGSVALVQSNPAALNGAHDEDLVLHLIGTHHGYGRPLPPIRQDDDPQSLEVTARSHNGGLQLCPPGHGKEQADGRMSMSVSSDLAATPLALEMADRFWRLQERYGHHGLAWLEAILRLADHQQSAEEARSHD